MMALSCNQAGLLAWMLLLLSLSEVQTQCPSPVLPPHSSLRGGGDLADTYPGGTVLRLQCIPGYEYISGASPRMTCLETNKWSALPTLCQGRRCPVPHLENGRIESSDDLRLGEEITLACDYGFRIIGGNTRRCVLKSGKVDWNRDVPFCERIPCARPPVILNGRYDPNPLDTYDAGSIVMYWCDADYSLIGNSIITCIVAKNGVDGEWNSPSPECKIVKCDPPIVENGKLVNLPKPSYTYNDGISLECNSGYSAVGSLRIKCGANSSWVPAIPKCVKDNCTSPVPPPHSTLKEDIPKEGYPVGTLLRYHCITGYEYIPEINPSITCLNTSKWSEISSLCQGKQCPPPNIENGNTDADDDNDIRLGGSVTFSCVHGYRLLGEATLKCILKDGKVDWNREFPLCERRNCPRPIIKNGKKLSANDFQLGEEITLACNDGFRIIGVSTLKCVLKSGKVDWDRHLPFCKQVKCHRPSIPNGKVASVYQATYTYQDKIEIECNAGYTLVGSSLIECDADSQWKPCVPRCDKDKSLEDQLDIIEKNLGSNSAYPATKEKNNLLIIIAMKP